MILKNAARCLDCDTIIESTHVHDFRDCLCGNVAVDGGHDYVRHVINDGARYVDLSIYANPDPDEPSAA